MKKLSFKGIIIGAIIDMISTSILGGILIAFVMKGTNSQGMSNEQFQATVTAILHGNSVYHAIHDFIGIVSSILGGYVAAKIAKQDALLNGALSSFLCVGFGIYSLLFTADNILVAVVNVVITPALSLLGGYLYLKRNSSVR